MAYVQHTCNRQRDLPLLLLLVMTAMMLTFCAQPTAAVAPEQKLAKWNDFKDKFHKKYSTPEEVRRYGIFGINLDKMEAHNKKAAAGMFTSTYGVNQFADWTPEEFRAILGARTDPYPRKSKLKRKRFHQTRSEIPDKFDWRNKTINGKNCITSVKDQGRCMSCWAFTAAAAMEAYHCIKYGQILDLSEQQLVDCTTVNQGCAGGWIQPAFDYIRDFSITTEGSYPYTAQNGTCQYTENVMSPAATCFDYTEVTVPPAHDEQAMAQALFTQGPLSVTLDANHDDFQFYDSGFLRVSDCTKQDDTNHAVLIVGYGKTMNGTPYWIVKNSWGTSWGLNGYFNIERNVNMCGVAKEPVYPDLTPAMSLSLRHHNKHCSCHRQRD